MTKKYANLTRAAGESIFVGVTADVKDCTVRFREKVGSYTPPGGKGVRVEMVTHVTRLEIPVEVSIDGATVTVTRSVEIRYHLEKDAADAASILAEALRLDASARDDYFALRGLTPPSEATFSVS